MSAHNMNKVVKYGSIGFISLLVIVSLLKGCGSDTKSTQNAKNMKLPGLHDSASSDSAAESLDTLTSQLSDVKKQIAEVVKDNEALRQQNTALQTQSSNNASGDNKVAATTVLPTQNAVNQSSSSNNTHDSTQSAAIKTMDKSLAQYRIRAGNGINLPAEATNDRSHFTSVATADMPAPGDNQPLTTINDLTDSGSNKPGSFDNRNAINSNHTNHNTNEDTSNENNASINSHDKKKPVVPFYTIPANATSVHDRLMTSLVGRIPIKGVVADPYPFKIVISDDTLAANGLRVPHLKQMIVSGYSEGDLVTSSVSGWVTSLTFVFQDGTIYNVSSNDNNIGKFSKDNALGYLSDKYGNPFIRGRLISNAPEYLGTKIGLSVASGFATAYSQAQTTNQTNMIGGNSSAVTGSPGKFMMGQGMAGGANAASQWFDDRAQQSFDAVYVPTVNEQGEPIEIAVNFTKEITIDYNPAGRKLNYEQTTTSNPITTSLD